MRYYFPNHYSPKLMLLGLLAMQPVLPVALAALEISREMESEGPADEQSPPPEPLEGE